jgi:predicted lipoprotein
MRRWRDAEAALQRSLAEAAGRSPVPELEEVIRRTQADPKTAARLTPQVAALNAALVRLVDLHRAHDSAQTVDSKHQIDAQAYAIHLEADTYEDDIHRVLTEDQHRRFHEYLEERAAAVGLPLDDSHGAPGVGRMGSIPSVGHPNGATHGDTAAPIDTTRSDRNDRAGSR